MAGPGFLASLTSTLPHVRLQPKELLGLALTRAPAGDPAPSPTGKLGPELALGTGVPGGGDLVEERCGLGVGG